MANVQKYAAAATGHLTAHYERRKIQDPETGKMEYVKFGNQDIDLSRSHLNYNLAPEREGGQIAFIRQRTTEARTLKRDDVKVLCSWVVTLPRKDEYGEVRSYTGRQIQEFFQEAYKSLANRYGEKNVVSAYVHMDETTPHMHFAFVPVIDDKKRGGEKVSAKDVLTRNDLQTFHVDLQRHMDERFGDNFFPILNGNTIGGNRTIMELKVEKASTDLNAVDNELSRAQIKLDETRAAMVKTAEQLRAKIDAISVAEVQLSDTSQKASEAAQKLSQVQKALQPLEARHAALERDMAVLEGLEEQVAEAKEELSILNEAIKEKNAEGEDKMGLTGWNAAIQRKKAEVQVEKKENLLARFAQWLIDQFPYVKKLWEQYQAEHGHQHTKTKHKRREQDIAD